MQFKALGNLRASKFGKSSVDVDGILRQSFPAQRSAGLSVKTSCTSSPVNSATHSANQSSD